MEKQRHCLVLTGTESWQQGVCDDLLGALPSDQVVCFSQAGFLPALLSERRHYRQAKMVLGKAYSAIIFQVHTECEIDSLALCLGAIGAGGILILCYGHEPLDNGLWHQRFERLLHTYQRRYPALFHTITEPAVVPQLSLTPLSITDKVMPTEDQMATIAAVKKVATGHRRRPLVVTAARGRGKSAALGIAAGQLLQQGKQNIVVTAPSRHAVATLFQHAEMTLGVTSEQPGRLICEYGKITFVAADGLIEIAETPDLVLIDEAAAIPVPLLQRYLTRFARIVFASTQQGYEGTGQGFAIKFQAQLDQQTPGWRQSLLQQPIRWGTEDKLEQWAQAVFLSDIGLDSAVKADEIEVTACRFRPVSQAALLADDRLLMTLFGLMQVTHYRTRPADILLLLEQADTTIWLADYQQQCVGCAIVVNEGGLAEEIAEAIYYGRRRLSGHLLPQSLLAHCGEATAGQYRYQRLLRLAVDPRIQGKGIGTALVKTIVAASEADIVGASFACNARVLAFWQRCGFTIAHLGHQRDEVSGDYSAMVLQGTNQTGSVYQQQLLNRFFLTWHDRLWMQYQMLPYEVVIAIGQQQPTMQQRLSAEEQQQVARFILNVSAYRLCQPVLRQLVCMTINQQVFLLLTSQQQQLAVSLLLQNQSMSTVVQKVGVVGKKALLASLADIMKQLKAFSLEDNMVIASK